MSTPSARLESRKKNGIYYGPWYDHYVKPFGKCHPDFDTILLNNGVNDPRGVKICVRRPVDEIHKRHPEEYMTYRYARSLYEPLVLKNYDNIPLESELIEKDYIKLNHDFNGTGLYRSHVCDNISESYY